MRKMASVRKVTDVQPIPSADRIEKVSVGGWDVVSQKGDFEVGDLCVYFEVDSLMPSDERWAFLESNSTPKTIEGKEHSGHVLKTMKLRGQLSQGLALPIEMFDGHENFAEGNDLTDELGIVKYEVPIPSEISGVVLGKRPHYVPMTDAERIQNLEEDLSYLANYAWACSEKVDGTSVSFFIEDGEFGVAGRNYVQAPNNKTVYWQIAEEYDIESLLGEFVPHSGRVALQGEIYGPKIQSNPLKVSRPSLACFRLMLNGRDITITEDFPLAPSVDVPFPVTVAEGLAAADNYVSQINPDAVAEGLVWRCLNGNDLSREQRCIKAISNQYLLKQ